MYSQWCKRMQQQAIDGTEAYNYFRLMQFWLERGLYRSFFCLRNKRMDKQSFFKSLIGEEVVFTIPRFRITKEAPKHGIVTGADSAFVYIDTEPYSIDLMEVE